jgi:hypothetical protein
MSRTVLRNVTGLKFGWKHSIAITSRSLHKCSEVLNQKFPITFRVHILHQEYWASSTVWYAFSAEHTLNYTILCVKCVISVKGWIWCPTPATAVFVNHPAQIKMALSLSHMFTISEFSTGKSGDSPTSVLWPLRVNKSGSSNSGSEFFVLPQDWCQAIAREEISTSLDVFQLVPPHVIWFCQSFLFAYVQQHLALHITGGGFFKFSPKTHNVISWTVNWNIKILYPKIFVFFDFQKRLFPSIL